MDLKKLYKRMMPSHQTLKEHRQLQIFGDILHDPDIFHLTRRSASGGVAIGLFVAFLPLPGHTLIAALLAIWLRLNMPLALVFAWTSNPLTITPMFFLAYKTGALLLAQQPRVISFELSYSWLAGKLLDIWQPLLLGCLLYGILSALCGFIAVRLLWRLAVMLKWDDRKRSRQG